MEVARVQLMVYEAANNIPEAAGSLSKLNSDLLDITTLYQDWAEPYQLWECKLAILATAGHPDPLLIQTIWTNIIDRELNRNTGFQTKKTAISRKIESLGRLYISSSKYFPLEYLVRKLEVASCAEGGDYTWVPTCLQNIGVDSPRLLDVYNRIYLAKESVWLTSGDELHVLRVLSSILGSFAENPGVVPLQDRRQFIVVAQDAVSAYLGELYMKQTQESATMINRFREIQTRLDRI
jgi:nuclear pore complex protein Nup155